ncbi:MAG: hypothetical protein MI749_07385, partial [Desulfovibrionales bacterium]|nr:hypothetical protein [Desulfovibrionales bacterium]
MWYSTTTDLLWRNALAVIPLALIVAAICRWGRCRPSTRHALWLGVLIWLIAGLLLPPVSFSTSDKSAVTTDLNTQSPKIGDLDIELDIELNLVSSDSEHKSSLGDRHPFREERDPDSEPKLRSLPDPLDIQPTPPETVVRTEPSVPHLLSSADDLVGPLSILGDESVDDDLAVVPASSVPEPVLPPSISKSSPDIYFESQAGSTPAQQAIPEPSHFGQWVNALVAMRDALGQLPTIPPIAWACGLAFILLVRLHRIAHFHRQMQTGAPAPASAIKMVSEAAEAMGLRRIPEVIVVHKRISPMIWCGRRLTLVLPRALWSELDETGRRAVVYHEMAHVRRRDH